MMNLTYSPGPVSDLPDDSTDAFSLDAGRLNPRPLQKTPYFVAIGGISDIGRTFRLEGQMILGRSEKAHLRVEADGVSRQHAKIEVFQDGTVRLVDLESTNGIFCNGTRIQARTLESGDRLQIGPLLILKFTYQDELEEQLQNKLYEAATRDGLTQAYNKKFLLDSLEREVAWALRHSLGLSLVMLDVDFFKRVNDTHGHPAGDSVLHGISAVIHRLLRKDDLFARYGGEEFALLLRKTGKEAAIGCAERMRTAIEKENIPYADMLLIVTVSAGVATLDAKGPATGEALISMADEKLYQAKQAGRNRVAH